MLEGSEKYLGGDVSAETGIVYTIPGRARYVVAIDPTQEPPTVTRIGPPFPGHFKWLRGVYTSHKGIIYGIPCHADSILRIDTRTNEVSTVTWDAKDPKAPPIGMPWKFHGGNLSPIDNCIYCIPQRAPYVLKLDPETEDISFLGDEPLVGVCKWYGGLLGKPDGAIYGICNNARGVLRINVQDQTVEVHYPTIVDDATGKEIPQPLPEGGYKWHGGVVAPNGIIYGIPAHSDRVLRVGTNTSQYRARQCTGFAWESTHSRLTSVYFLLHFFWVARSYPVPNHTFLPF